MDGSLQDEVEDCAGRYYLPAPPPVYTNKYSARQMIYNTSGFLPRYALVRATRKTGCCARPPSPLAVSRLLFHLYMSGILNRAARRVKSYSSSDKAPSKKKSLLPPNRKATRGARIRELFNHVPSRSNRKLSSEAAHYRKKSKLKEKSGKNCHATRRQSTGCFYVIKCFSDSFLVLRQVCAVLYKLHLFRFVVL